MPGPAPGRSEGAGRMLFHLCVLYHPDGARRQQERTGGGRRRGPQTGHEGHGRWCHRREWGLRRSSGAGSICSAGRRYRLPRPVPDQIIEPNLSEELIAHPRIAPVRQPFPPPRSRAGPLKYRCDETPVYERMREEPSGRSAAGITARVSGRTIVGFRARRRFFRRNGGSPGTDAPFVSPRFHLRSGKHRRRAMRNPVEPWELPSRDAQALAAGSGGFPRLIPGKSSGAARTDLRRGATSGLTTNHIRVEVPEAGGLINQIVPVTITGARTRGNARHQGAGGGRLSVQCPSRSITHYQPYVPIHHAAVIGWLVAITPRPGNPSAPAPRISG